MSKLVLPIINKHRLFDGIYQLTNPYLSDVDDNPSGFSTAFWAINKLSVYVPSWQSSCYLHRPKVCRFACVHAGPCRLSTRLAFTLFRVAFINSNFLCVPANKATWAGAIGSLKKILCMPLTLFSTWEKSNRVQSWALSSWVTGVSIIVVTWCFSLLHNHGLRRRPIFNSMYSKWVLRPKSGLLLVSPLWFINKSPASESLIVSCLGLYLRAKQPRSLPSL